MPVLHAFGVADHFGDTGDVRASDDNAKEGIMQMLVQPQPPLEEECPFEVRCLILDSNVIKNAVERMIREIPHAKRHARLRPIWFSTRQALRLDLRKQNMRGRDAREFSNALALYLQHQGDLHGDDRVVNGECALMWTPVDKKGALNSERFIPIDYLP